MFKTQHYLRIHRRVCRRAWLELPSNMKHIIANDVNHTSDEYKWFENKVNADTQRLYEDPNYYDNAEYTFRIPANERV